MATFEKAVLEWADTINDWYNLSASSAEVTEAFNALKEYRDAEDEPGEESYIETFFHGLGKMPGGKPVWRTGLDTVDREHLAGFIEGIRKIRTQTS
jgi:hypothetical protein